MDSNSYPTFPDQNNNQYNYTSFAPQNTQSEPILVGVPVSANKGQAQYPNLQPAIPMPTGAQPTFNYGQIPQASSQFVSPQMGVLHQPRNNHINPEKQNKGYVELANAQNFEKTYHTEDMSQENLNIAQGVAYPHLPGPMVTPDPQFAHITAEMHPPIVYDPSLLNTINSREPQIAICQRCNKRVQTIVKYEIGTGTLISSCFLAMFGALPCAWVPCCMKDLKDAVHICPVCGGQVGVKKFMVN